MSVSQRTFSRALVCAAFALMSMGGIATAAATSAQAQTVGVWHSATEASGFPGGHGATPCDTCVIAII
jgi:hypothetical protein